MADRGYSKTRIHRTPLGDATSRVANASPEKRGKQNPNPLRAHPVSGSSQKIPARAPPLVASSNGRAPQTKESLTVNRAPSHLAPALRVTGPSTNNVPTDSRYSQISASSSASGGNRKTHIGPWQLGRTLGKGSAARVRLARHQATQNVVAVKILAKNMTQLAAAGSLAEIDKWDRTREEFNAQRHMPLSIEREVAILKLIDHPHIVKLYDIWENRAEIYLVLEYMDGGDMFSYIHNYGPLPEFETMGYFRQILTALEYVHSFNICHRDLKPENILMQSNGVVKIADFGMAAIQQSPTHSLQTSCGSPHYAAPELISRTRYKGAKIDVWSLGCVLYVTLCRRLPFDDPDGDIPRLLGKAQRGVYTIPEFIGKEARDLITKMLTVDPQKRISIRKIWQHALIKKYDDLDDFNDRDRTLRSRANDNSKPVPAEEIDMRILRQLKSMWHTFSEKHIAMQLCNTEPNDQKLFYWLLTSYREKELENYDADLACSASDFHHLRPANWKKKVTTAEFPSRYGRTPSKFTVISTVPTDDGMDDDNATDRATIMSYDPYKSSRVMDNASASHAKIVVHRRNGSIANNSARSSASQRRRRGSVKSTSTRSKQTRGSRRIATSASMRPSQLSMVSIQSGESAPYKRPATRRKRRVNFSHSRTQLDLPHITSSIIEDDEAYGPSPEYVSSTRSVGDHKIPRTVNGRTRAGTQSMASMSQMDKCSPYWNEEVREFSHSIARDCDDAFNSSLLDPDSYLSNASNKALVPADIASLSGTLAASTPAPSKHPFSDTHAWEHRPLPPTPSTTSSVAHEIMMAKNRNGGDASAYNNNINSRHAFRPTGAAPGSDAIMEEEPNYRISSAPIYSQYSTQWGKDKIALPSIHERTKEETYGNASDKYRNVSAPTRYTKAGSVMMDDHRGLEYLSRHDNTIRVVDSPSNRPIIESDIPRPLNIRKRTPQGLTSLSQPRQGLDLRQRYLEDDQWADVGAVSPNVETEDLATSVVTKKKPSWFKRDSKDKEDVSNIRRDSAASQSNPLTYVSTTSSTGQPSQPTKKKSFNFAFWRNSKPESEMQMSLAESDTEETSRHKRVPNRLNKSSHHGDGGDQTATRNIEPQQNWLARLFRVKPATGHLCFTVSRRRARQETAILLREWRKYGMRDVEVDKDRNIVFARLGQPNYLNLKEVTFAAEIMTVIEHGKRGHLCIARFTQERGAASSFHKVVDTINSVFGQRNLLVVDQRKIKMMIKTLNSS